MPAMNLKCGKETGETSSKVTKATLHRCINAYNILKVIDDVPEECKGIMQN
jgi:hypothetical protein